MDAEPNSYNKIDTFVFFDLGTKGLIKGSEMPYITELSMVAIDRKILEVDTRDMLALPRNIHKLTIPVSPVQPRYPQNPVARNLWSESRKNIKPFDKLTYNMIMNFIDRLPGVVCFVAHNGNRFDYPVFLAELGRIQQTFPDNILCVDTLIAFREFFDNAEPVVQRSIKILPQIADQLSYTSLDDHWNAVLCSAADEVERRERSRLALENVQKLIYFLPDVVDRDSCTSLDDRWNDALCSVLDGVEKKFGLSLSIENDEDVSYRIANENQQISDTSAILATPKTSPLSMQAINERTPQNRVTPNLRSSLKGVRRRLNFGDSQPQNYKLTTIHVHMFRREPDILHQAEADCITLLQCVRRLGPYFVQWADLKAVSLNLSKS